MSGRVFRINKLGGKPFRVSIDGCTLSLNLRTETEGTRFLLRRERYAAYEDASLDRMSRRATVLERDNLRMELRARSDLRKYAEAQREPPTEGTSRTVAPAAFRRRAAG